VTLQTTHLTNFLQRGFFQQGSQFGTFAVFHVICTPSAKTILGVKAFLSFKEQQLGLFNSLNLLAIGLDPTKAADSWLALCKPVPYTTGPSTRLASKHSTIFTATTIFFDQIWQKH
jgi:hypothetical protein